MLKNNNLALFLLVVFLAAPQIGVGAQRQLLTYQDVRVMIDDRPNWCANTVTMNLVANDATFFSVNSGALQKLLGGIRATMGFECPQATRINLVGTVDNVQTYKGYATANESWRLQSEAIKIRATSVPAITKTEIPSDLKPESPASVTLTKTSKPVTQSRSAPTNNKTAAPVATGEFAYLNKLPSVQEVLDSESGTNIDSEARRVGKLIILKNLIEEKAGVRLFRGELTKAESYYRRLYGNEIQRLVQASHVKFTKESGKYAKFLRLYSSYGHDTDNKVSLLEKNLPAEAFRIEQEDATKKRIAEAFRIEQEDATKKRIRAERISRATTAAGTAFVGTYLVPFAAGMFVLWLAYRKFTAKKRLNNKIMRRRKERNRESLALFGRSQKEREQIINKVFDKQEDNISYEDGFKKENGVKRLEFFIYRALSTMPPKERETLRAAYLLYNAGLMDDYDFDIARLGLLFGNGKCKVQSWEYDFSDSGHESVKSINDAINILMSWHNASVESIVTHVFAIVDQLAKDKSDDPTVKSVRKHLKGGHTWFSEEDMEDGIFAPTGGYALRIGMLVDSDTPLTFSGEGSIISIAPPGSGKTQCNVFPNLLTWKGPAVVLDVKGEIYEGTSKWRSENVGPVFKFSPLDPDNSHCYNPLAFIRQEAEFIWEDSRFLADMMIVPSDAKDPFWETKARDILTAAIAYVSYSNGPHDRPMSKIIDILHRIGWDEMVSALKMNVEVRSMTRMGSSLDAMDAKTLDSVLQTAQASLSAWDGERINRVTQRSDWSPLDLRRGQNPTIYICLKPNEVDSYISLLRVFIAQHIRMLTSELPPRDAAPILFMLDELPRLKQMPPVEEALEIGRQYGIRMWMFAQSLGQLQNAYENADGMIGSCAVRIYMNPSLHDGTAQKLSDDIGMREAVLDGTQKKIVEPAELAGPEYKDIQIVMATSCKPVKVRKEFTYQNKELSDRMGSL